MNDDKIKLIKLYSGEMIIGEIENCESDSSKLLIFNPRSVFVAHSLTGGLQIVIGNVCEPFKVERLSKELTVFHREILFAIESSELPKEVIDGYKSEVSGIQIASASDTAALNSPFIPDFK